MKNFLAVATLLSMGLTACNSGSSSNSMAYLPQGSYIATLSNAVSNPASLDCTVSNTSSTGDIFVSNGNGQITNINESSTITLNLNNNPCTPQLDYTIATGFTATEELKNCQYNSTTSTMTAINYVTIQDSTVTPLLNGTCSSTLTLTKVTTSTASSSSESESN